ncbi:MAG: phasin family protein [bacterium]|nr:phasin family protein [bacterium]
MTDKKDFQAELKDNAHKIWLAGLGALSAAEEEGSKVFKSLVERGEAFENRGRERYDEVRTKVEDAAGEARDKAESSWDKVESRLDDAVASALGRLGVPSRDEIATLTKRVEELTAVVEQLKPVKTVSAKKVPARKSTASTKK